MPAGKTVPRVQSTTKLVLGVPPVLAPAPAPVPAPAPAILTQFGILREHYLEYNTDDRA
uniref:HDC14195 n=1 Tax=Drosophila melanogaster TaxID=7227 RepID=Q6IJU8_DROME|nr:TPA_inf: HDC14195 [Drosophila melanogaster]